LPSVARIEGADFLQGLPTSDVVIWTGGFSSSPMGAFNSSSMGTGGAGVHAICRGCSSSSSLAGPVSSGFLAGSSALVHGLEWCRSHL